MTKDGDRAASLPYRPCVGIMLLDRRGHVFVGRRIDTPEAWQMPQGGIHKRESPLAAARRELKEEIGTDSATVLAQNDEWLRYDLPDHLRGKVFKGRYGGQKQKWFAMGFEGRDEDIDPGAVRHPEFDAWKWVPMDQLPRLIVPFKRPIYERLVELFGHLAAPRAR